jgi:hypothetical protein
MAPIATCRCPSCGALNPLEQSICVRCLGALPPSVSMPPAEPMIGETCSLYRASATDASLLLSAAALEYTSSRVAFTTTWNDVESITHGVDEDLLWLYQTPQRIKLPLANSRVWFSDITRTIPLRQFGYPTNRELSLDLYRYAPQLRRILETTVAPRD